MKPFNKITALTATATLLPAQLAFAGQNELGTIPWGYGHMGYGMGFGGWLFGPLMMILFVAAIVAVVVWIMRGAGTGQSKQSHDAALAILNERFARGEIDKAEYEERRSALGS